MMPVRYVFQRLLESVRFWQTLFLCKLLEKGNFFLKNLKNSHYSTIPELYGLV